MTRSSVDFPQPEGPTKTTNSPSFTARSMPCSTSMVPKDLRALVSFSSAMVEESVSSFHSGRADARRDETLEEHEDEGDGNERHDRHRKQIVPLGLQFTLEGIEPDLERIDLSLGQDRERPQKFVPAPHD